MSIDTTAQRTIVALGDSTTAGTPGFRSPVEAPPNGEGNEQSQYAWWLMRRRPGWRVLNRGVNGERADQIRGRFARHVMVEAPDAVVIIAGVNDIYQGRPPSHVMRELQAMYDMAACGGLPVVAGTIIPFNTATPEQNAAMAAVNAWIRDYSETHATIVFCDTRRAVAPAGHPDLLAESPDRLHPSVGGYRLMAEALEPAIAAALGERGASLVS